MNLTQTKVQKLKPKDNRYDVYDDAMQGLALRIETSGRKTWYLCYRNPATKKRSMRKLGLASHITVAQAREIAREYMATLIATREDPAEIEKRQRERLTLDELINIYYTPWIKANRKGWRFTLECLDFFKDFYPTVVEELTPLDIEKWQLQEREQNLKGATINRRLTALQALLNWGLKRNLIAINPIRHKVERQKETDSVKKIRYLTAEERHRLLTALNERDKKEKDYLKTAVIMSLNTGIRKGTLLRLKWGDLDWNNKTIHLRAEIMKGGIAKTIPVNAYTVQTLKKWQVRSGNTTGFIFPGEAGLNTHLKDTKKPWNNLLRQANLEDFSWNCMRHDFASQLAMQGTDILTIKELMCHENLKMTLVYAHLSPLHTRVATDKLAKLYK
ncbi:MAG: tyrosine-type recombinase/integrase [Aminobacterium sp.]|nr:tyrosine-type recombinase/integrase [Aminobacterium sp.]